MATLTGAQMVSSPACYSQMTLRACQVTTGRKHAGVVSDSERLEQAAVAAGKASGDLVFPMLYCPEMLTELLESPTADMRNNTSDRMNAQSSTAAQFVKNQLPEDWSGEWLHCDIAGPASDKEYLATGYGPALIVELLGLGSQAK